MRQVRAVSCLGLCLLDVWVGGGLAQVVMCIACSRPISLSLSLFLSHIHRGPRWLYLVEGGWRSANSVVDFEVSQAVRPHATHQQLHNKDNHKFGAQIIPTAETPNKDNHNKFLAQIIHFLELWHWQFTTGFCLKSFTLQKPQQRQSQKIFGSNYSLCWIHHNRGHPSITMILKMCSAHSQLQTALAAVHTHIQSHK